MADIEDEYKDNSVVVIPPVKDDPSWQTIRHNHAVVGAVHRVHVRGKNTTWESYDAAGKLVGEHSRRREAINALIPGHAEAQEAEIAAEKEAQ